MAAVAVRMSLQGDKAMLERLRRVAADTGMRKVARGAALEFAGVLVERMKPLTPFKTGKLRDSERARVMVSSKREDIRVTVLAGGPNAPYAVQMHEVHPTQSKFMERVILGAVATAAQELASRIDLRQTVPA